MNGQIIVDKHDRVIHWLTPVFSKRRQLPSRSGQSYIVGVVLPWEICNFSRTGVRIRNGYSCLESRSHAISLKCFRGSLPCYIHKGMTTTTRQALYLQILLEACRIKKNGMMTFDVRCLVKWWLGSSYVSQYRESDLLGIEETATVSCKAHNWTLWPWAYLL